MHYFSFRGPHEDQPPRQRHYGARAACLHPTIRAKRPEPVRELGISVDTAHHRHKCPEMMNRPSTPHRLWSVLTSAQEAVVVQLRQTLLLLLDDLLMAVRKPINSTVSRSGLDCCLRRHKQTSNLRDVIPEVGEEAASRKRFKDDASDFFPMDIKCLPQMAVETARRPPQSAHTAEALAHRTPLEARRQWQRDKPELFAKAVRRLPGPRLHIPTELCRRTKSQGIPPFPKGHWRFIHGPSAR